MLRAGFLHQTRGLDHHGMTLLPQLGRRPYHPLLYLFNAMHHLYLPTYGPRKACREATLLDFSRTSRHGHITYGPGWTVIWTRGAQNAGVLYRGLAGQVALIPACDVGAACERFLPRRRLDRGRTLLPVVMGVAGPSCLVGDCAGRRDSVHSMTPMQHSSLRGQLPRSSSASTRVNSRWLKTCRGNKRKLRNVHKRRIR